MLRTPLIHHNKKAARLALYGSAVVFAALAVGIVLIASRMKDGVDRSWRQIDYENDEAVQLLQAYLRIDTSATTGSEVPGAEFLAAELAAVGIEAHIERIGEQHANLWAILEGDDPQALVLHSHIDVDPIFMPDAWKYPPFEATIELPWLFGRGAFDMKSVTIAQLIAFKALKTSGKPLARTVIFLATGEEETGSRLGTQWILRYHPELVARFGAVLTEGGVVEARGVDDIKFWGTEHFQKRFIPIVACHESWERLEGLREDLSPRDLRPFQRKVAPPVADFLRSYAETRDYKRYRALLAEPEQLAELDHFMDLAPFHQALIRNEIWPYKVEEAPGGGYQLQMTLHPIPGESLEDALADVLPDWMTFGVSLAIEVPHPEVAPSPMTHPVFQALQAYFDEHLPSAQHGPYIVPRSATDARFFRAAGVPAYGFTPFHILTTDTLQIKGPNERIVLPAFLAGVDLYVDLVRDLALRLGEG